jgi:hypothetical protein
MDGATIIRYNTENTLKGTGAVMKRDNMQPANVGHKDWKTA